MGQAKTKKVASFSRILPNKVAKQEKFRIVKDYGEFGKFEIIKQLYIRNDKIHYMIYVNQIELPKPEITTKKRTMSDFYWSYKKIVNKNGKVSWVLVGY